MQKPPRGVARRVLITALVLAFSIAIVAPVAAGPPTEQLRGHVDRVIKILVDSDMLRPNRLAERRAAIRKVANDIFDFDEIARRTLGRHWPPRSPEERREFVLLMADLLEQAYIGKIETYSGENVVFAGDAVDGDRATVKTRIVTKSGTEIPVDYRMVDRSGRWSAYDVFVEGVSLVANYRGQFDRIIQKQSYAELVKALRAKQAERKDDTGRRDRLAESGTPKSATGAPGPTTTPLRVQSP
jgi:phospholipid transport system substrate-binding protein